MPTAQLLDFRVQEGWEPLCAFLGVPVPDVPFPRVNDTDTLKKAFRGIVFKGLLRWGLILGSAAASIAVTRGILW